MAQNRRKILLTGGSGGLGRLVAVQFLREGADVTVVSRTWVANGTTGVRHVGIDLATPAGMAEASALAASEQPDILVNMAGVQFFGPVEAQSWEEMFAGYMVNLVAPVSLCRACLPFMKRRNSGQIVNIGSIFGSIPLAHFATYSSAKAGLQAFSQALRRELVGTDIAVTYIAPRAVATGMLTPQIRKYAAATRMKVDAPESVSKQIVSAINARRKEIYMGLPENFFVRINALLPGLVDAAVRRGDRKVQRLFVP